MENIRIVSGYLRGRSIKSPRDSATHPMGSREKIALFNMISAYLPGATVLDAFAGSGALGIEAISRGAENVAFVEKSPKVARVIKDNLASLELQAEVFVDDIDKYSPEESFDLVIADPPYDHFTESKILPLTNILKDGGLLILSHPGTPPVIEGLNLTKTRKYAKANISIYQK